MEIETGDMVWYGETGDMIWYGETSEFIHEEISIMDYKGFSGTIMERGVMTGGMDDWHG